MNFDASYRVVLYKEFYTSGVWIYKIPGNPDKGETLAPITWGWAHDFGERLL